MRKFCGIAILTLLFIFVLYDTQGQSTAVYTVSTTTSVTSSGTAPSGSSATYSQTYATAKQLTGGTNAVLTLSGYAGKRITSIVLNMRSNTSSGAGTLSVIAGSTTISSVSPTAAFNTASWYGAWSTSYVNITKTPTAYDIATGESVVITIAATANSLYINSYSITWVDACTPPTPTFTATPSSPSCTNTDITYTTQSGKSSYVWSIPGTLNTDYTITSGGTGSDNSATVKFLTGGSKNVTVGYTDGCASTTPASNTTTIQTKTVSIAPTTTQNIAASTNGTALSVTEGSSTVSSREWKYTTTSGSGYTSFSPAQTGASYTPNFASSGTYYVVCQTTYGSPCSTTTTSNEVQINVSGGSVTLSPSSQSFGPFCNGSANSVAVTYTTTGTVTSPYLQLSNSSGSFVSGTTNLGGTVTGSGPYTITANIPIAQSAGTYRVRIVSTDGTPVVSADNGNNITVSATPTTPNSSTPSAVCQGNAVTITGSGSTGATTYTYWSASSGGTQYTTGSPAGYTVSGGNLTTPASLTAGTYNFYVQGENASSCSSLARQLVIITINGLPSTPANPTAAANPACGSTSLNTMVPPGGETYYWQGTNASGTSTASSTAAPYSVSSTGTYYVRSQNTNGCWSASGGSVFVTVSSSISITTQPVNQSVAIGATATFSVVATGTIASYQWQLNTGSGWSDISGATSSSYTTAATVIGMNGYLYRCVVKANSPCTDVTSSAVALYVASSPCHTETFSNIGSTTGYGTRTWTGDDGSTWQATQAREDQTITGKAITINSGGVVTSPTFNDGVASITLTTKFPFTETTGSLTVKVNGTTVGTVAYADMSGSTPITKTFSGINVSGSVVITLTSSVARFTIDDLNWLCYSSCISPADPVGSITATTNPSCGATTLSFPASAVTDVTYYWQGTNSAGVSTSTATNGTANYTASSTGTYYVRAYNAVNACWSINSISSAITINATPAVTTNPTSTSIQVGGSNVTFSVAASGTVGSYQWECDNGSAGASWTPLSNAAPYSNVTTATMTVAAATSSISMNGYRYRCVVNGASPCGSVTSTAATLTVINQAPNNPTMGTSCAGFTAYNTMADVTWTAPATGVTPDGYLVFVIPGSTAPAGTLNDANTYSANADYSLAITASPATLGKCVYKGTGTSVQVTGLSSGATYSFRVYAFVGNTNTGWSSGSAGASKTGVTFTIPNVTALAATIANGQSVVSWTLPSNTSPNCWDEVMVAVNQGAVSLSPSGNGSAYTASTTYAGANQVVYKGTGSSVTVSGLTNGTQYCFKVFTRKGAEWSTGTSYCVIPGIPVTDNGCDAGSFASMTISYPTNLVITKVTVGVKATTTYRGDLIVKLVSPTGTEVTLENQVGSSADNLDALFDDAGSGSATSGNHTVDDTYDITCSVQGSPTQPLSTFNGELSQGVWTLKVCDGSASDLAYLQKFELNITGTTPCTPTATITSFAPTNGPEGTIVTITGTGFTGATAVKFGTVSSGSFTVVNSTTIKAEVPSGVSSSSVISVTDATACTAKSSSSFSLLNSSGSCGAVNASGDLMITEVYDATTGDNQFVEIYNPTLSTISLTNYTLRIIAYGNSGSSTTNITFTSGASIAAGGLYLLMIGNTSSTCSGVTPNQTNASGGFNGNDEVYLIKSGTTIDYVPNPPSLSGAGFSQIRKSTVSSPSTTYNSSEWDVYGTESCSNLGVVGTPIVITAQPADVSACSINLSVTATPSSGLLYGWYYQNGTTGAWAAVSNGTGTFSGATVSGADAASLSITGDLTNINAYQFYCYITNGVCEKYSNAVQFAVSADRYFKSVTPVTGNWTSASNWLMSTSSTGPWSSACTYPTSSNSDYISVESGSTLTIDLTALTIDQMTIQSGGTVKLLSTTKLTVDNGAAGSDLTVLGTLEDGASSANSIVFNSSATWSIGANGNLIKTNNSSSSSFQSNYEGGISTIPSTANWIFRYTGTSAAISVSTIGAYYPNLIFESNSGNWTPSTAFSKFTGSSGFATVKGNLDIGGTGSGTVSPVINDNTNAQALLVLGNLVVRSGSTLTNIGAANGTGFEVRGDVTINGTLTSNGGSGLLLLSGAVTSPQTLSGTGTINLMNMTVNKTGIGGGVLLSKDISIPFSGTLTITNGLLNAQTQTLNGAGNLTMTGGSLQLSKNGVTLPELTGTYTLTGGTVIFNGNGTGANAQTVRAVNYYNLTSTSTGDRILPSSGTVGVAAAFTPNYPSQTYTITGSTVDFNGSAAVQNIPAFTFYNVGVKNGGTKTLVATDTVLNELTLGSNPSSSDGTVLALSNYDIVLRSTSALTAKVNKTALPSANVTYGNGRFVVERYLPMQTPFSGRRWRLIGVPVSSTNAPTIREAWQENATPTPTTTSATTTASIYNPNPGYGTHITNGIGSVNNANGFDAGSTSSPSIYKLEPGSSIWAAPTSTNQLITNYNAYMLFVRGDRSIVVSNQYINTTGGTNIRTRGKINIGQFQKTIYPGFNAISNPYASPISMRTVNYDGTGSLNTYYLWDPKLLGSYAVGGWATFSWDGFTEYDFTPYSGNATGMSSYSGNGIIESGMAFMINKTTSSNTTVEFTESSKTTASNNTTGIASRPSGNQPMKFYTNLLYKSSTDEALLADGVMTSFGGGASNDFDEMDVEKLQTFLTKERIGQLRNGSLYAIERRSDVTLADTVFLQMLKLTNNYNYRLQFITKNINTTLVPFLIDHYLKKTTLVKIDSTFDYDFVTNADAGSVATDRFTVVFKLREGSVVLPVNFINVSAVKQSSAVNKVAWQLGNQLNVAKYNIERSYNGIDFSVVGTALATNMNNYHWLDNTDASVVYYRVAAIDKDGSVQYSKIVKVSSTNTLPSVSLVTNPVITHVPLSVQLNNMPLSKYVYAITNALGQQMLKGEFTGGGNSAIVELNAIAIKGVYYLTITGTDKRKYSLKVVVE